MSTWLKISQKNKLKIHRKYQSALWIHLRISEFPNHFLFGQLWFSFTFVFLHIFFYLCLSNIFSYAECVKNAFLTKSPLCIIIKTVHLRLLQRSTLHYTSLYDMQVFKLAENHVKNFSFYAAKFFRFYKKVAYINNSILFSLELHFLFLLPKKYYF